MVRKCIYNKCNHKSKDGTCSFHRVPCDRIRALKWLQACGDGRTPSKLGLYVYVCSHHFENGDCDPTPCNITPSSPQCQKTRRKRKNTSNGKGSGDHIYFKAPKDTTPQRCIPGKVSSTPEQVLPSGITNDSITVSPIEKTGVEETTQCSEQNSQKVGKRSLSFTTKFSPWKAKGCAIRKKVKMDLEKSIQEALSKSPHRETDVAHPSSTDAYYETFEPLTTNAVNMYNDLAVPLIDENEVTVTKVQQVPSSEERDEPHIQSLMSSMSVSNENGESSSKQRGKPLIRRSLMSTMSSSNEGGSEGPADNFTRLHSTNTTGNSSTKVPVHPKQWRKSTQTQSNNENCHQRAGKKKVENFVVPHDCPCLDDNSQNSVPRRYQEYFVVASDSSTDSATLPLPGVVRVLARYEECRQMPAKDFHFYTGVTPEAFEVLYEFLGGEEVCPFLKYRYNKATPKKQPASIMSLRDRLFMSLIRLRRGVPLKDLSYIFGISIGFASEVFYTWIRFISLEFEEVEKFMLPSAADQEEDRAECSKLFPNVRVVFDAAEFQIQMPTHFEQQSNTWSSYKKRNTAKIGVGVTTTVGIAFVSDVYEGSISDKQLIKDCGILQLLEPGDAIMMDRGFDIEAELNELDVEIIIPPFLGGRDHFTQRELLLAKAISSARVHVERAIAKIKEFRLLRSAIPIPMLPILGDMVKVCAFLVNFGEKFV